MRRATIVVLLAVLVLAACGSDKKKATGSAPTTTTTTKPPSATSTAPPSTTTTPGDPKLVAINFQVKDFPAGWKSKPHVETEESKAFGRQLRQCAGIQDATV